MGLGERGRLDEVLQDAYLGRLKPLYNYMADLPGMEGVPIPILAAGNITKNIGVRTSFDSGRGCPFQCSFCTIINVQGRKSRYRTADDIEFGHAAVEKMRKQRNPKAHQIAAAQ